MTPAGPRLGSVELRAGRADGRLGADGVEFVYAVATRVIALVPSAVGVASGPALVEVLRSEARRLGFSRLGIAAVESGRDPQVHEAFRRWLDLGFAAGMERWLAAHEPLRREPASLLAGVRSVVMLATDYAAAAPAAGGGGRVSRYAWGDDYHDLLRPRLNALGAWLEAASPGARTRGVVDSAPFSELFEGASRAPASCSPLRKVPRRSKAGRCPRGCTEPPG